MGTKPNHTGLSAGALATIWSGALVPRFVDVGSSGGLGSFLVRGVTTRYGFETALFVLGALMFAAWPLALLVLKDKSANWALIAAAQFGVSTLAGYGLVAARQYHWENWGPLSGFRPAGALRKLTRSHGLVFSIATLWALAVAAMPKHAVANQ